MTLLFFPIFAIAASAMALLWPPFFADFKSWIVPLLMLVMLGMGLHLSVHDFKRVWQYRKLVLFGVGLQFLIMPFTAWLLSKGLGLSDELLIGMVLVGATAGGTASNVIAYLAKGDVALSVSMTVVSTLAAVFMLPLMSLIYLGQSIDVPAISMLGSLIKIIIVPVLIGILIHRFYASSIERLASFTSWFSMLVIVFIIAIVVALNHANFAELAGILVLAVILHNLIGLLSGYFLARRLGYDSVIARTVAIEVGMQNSGLSVALALKFFTPASALPAALFSLWHNISGIIFALFWSVQRKHKKS